MEADVSHLRRGETDLGFALPIICLKRKRFFNSLSEARCRDGERLFGLAVGDTSLRHGKGRHKSLRVEQLAAVMVCLKIL